MAIPYAPRGVYQPDNTIIGLIQQAGRDAAQGQRAGGAIWGNTVNGLGQIAAGTIQDIAAGKAQAAEMKRKEEMERPRIEAENRKRTLEIQGLERARADADRKAADDESFKGILRTGTREKVLASFQGDPDRYKQALEHFGRMDSHKNTMLGEAAAAIRLMGDSPEAAMAQLDDLAETGWNPKEIEEMKAQIQQNPANIPGIVDDFLVNSPVEAHKALASVNKKPDTRSLALQLNDALQKGDKVAAGRIQEAIRLEAAAGRAPAAPKEPVYKDINGIPHEIKNGVAIPVKIQGAAPQDVPPAEAPFVAQPAFQKLPTAAKNQVVKAAELINTAKEYRKLVLDNVGDSGLLLSGPMAAEINSAHGNLAFKGAGGYGQGALQAPDREVMEEIFTNPASLSPSAVAKTSIRGGKKGIKQSLDRAVKRLEDDLYRVYGLKLDDVAPLENGTRVPAPAPAQQSGGGVSVTLPNGKTKMFPNQAAADGFKKAAGIK